MSSTLYRIAIGIYVYAIKYALYRRHVSYTTQKAVPSIDQLHVSYQSTLYAGYFSSVISAYRMCSMNLYIYLYSSEDVFWNILQIKLMCFTRVGEKSWSLYVYELVNRIVWDDYELNTRRYHFRTPCISCVIFFGIDDILQVHELLTLQHFFNNIRIRSSL